MRADPRHKRLVNLLARGRRLHYDNAKKLAAQVLSVRLPFHVPAMAELVYQAAQMLFALTFLEQRGYLAEAEYDPFTDQLFAEVTGPQGKRVYGLVQTYAGALADEARLAGVLAADLSAALIGKADPRLTSALANTPRAIRRTTQLYCAITFDDKPMIAKLQ